MGLVQRNGSRADAELVRAMTDSLYFRGPDGCGTWSDGQAALGHAELRLSPEWRTQGQPFTLDGALTIVADARLDAREQLAAKLSGGEGQRTADIPDAVLIARAYAKWGESCVERLAGDFSFGIWDAQTKSLFCARDHFGIKPFYFAETAGDFLFSNTFECLRMHPDVADELNEEAIGDFLLFGLNRNPDTTAFRDIQRLPPAHCMTVARGGIRRRRYWSAPTDGRIRYDREEEYVEHFRSLLNHAVAERLDGRRTGILLSGGLDSSSLAAVAKEIQAGAKSSGELRAFTVVANTKVEDEDRSLARETAEFLGIPQEEIALDDLQPFEQEKDSAALPEPVSDPFWGGLFSQFRRVAASCRVALDGEGSDNLMHFEMWPYVKDMARRFEVREMASKVPAYLRVRGSILPGIQRRIQEASGNHPDLVKYPEWINPEFERRMNLREKFDDWGHEPVHSEHPRAPKAHGSLSLPHWTHLFENENAGVTRAPVEVRFPFLDLRVVSFVLSVPPFPWMYKKRLLREAMVGKLLDKIRVRPKTPMTGDPLMTNLSQARREGLNKVQWMGETDRYVDRENVMRKLEEEKSFALSSAIRPVCLNFWLQSRADVRYKIRAEAQNG